LPVPSLILNRIAKTIENPNISAEEIGEVIRMDPSLSSKVLKLANSAYIGMPKTISSLPRAVVILGTKRIQMLLITTEVISSFSKLSSKTFSFERFRFHSIIVGLIAESIAKSIKRTLSIDENEAFAAGLLHDIGKLVGLIASPEEVIKTYEESKEKRVAFFKAEKDEISHTEIGEKVAGKWLFPKILSSSIKFHHAPQNCDEFNIIVSIIHIADVMAHLLGCATFLEEIPPQVEETSLNIVGLPIERLKVIAENILKEKEKISSLLNIFESKE
ncbi:MAG: HDOD domain-containing protein, partial [Chitinispirillaceae bacterium]|nr:HDOD domain-containing protein [Chitinispirillaceae bacterium]